LTSEMLGQPHTHGGLASAANHQIAHADDGNRKTLTGALATHPLPLVIGCELIDCAGKIEKRAPSTQAGSSGREIPDALQLLRHT
jgi:hypothetical protein